MAFGSKVSNDVDEAVAVIGFALKFPGDADSPASFWSMLEDGKSAMSDWPEDRLTMEAFHHRDSTASERVCNLSPRLFQALIELVVSGLRTGCPFPERRPESL